MGGLGSNENHMSEFAHCFPFPITYLDPYKLKLESPQDLVDWFEAHTDSNTKTCIIAHSLGGDLARYLASNMSQITNLVLLDGGYLDMEHILSLEQEIEETLAYLKQQVFPSLEEAVASELGDTDNTSPATIKAIQSVIVGILNSIIMNWIWIHKRFFPCWESDESSDLIKLL